MSPTDRDDIEIAVVINIHDLRSIMMLVACIHQMLRPCLPIAIDILENIQLGAGGIRCAVFARSDVEIPIAIHICHVNAHRSCNRGNGVLIPKAGRHGGRFIPGQQTRFADCLIADDRIQPPIPVDICQLIPIRVPNRI